MGRHGSQGFGVAFLAEVQGLGLGFRVEGLGFRVRVCKAKVWEREGV